MVQDPRGKLFQVCTNFHLWSCMAALALLISQPTREEGVKKVHMPALVGHESEAFFSTHISWAGLSHMAT